jgi:hypothetical protein
MYFRGLTQVRVKIEPTINTNPNTVHNDSVLILLLEENQLSTFPTGQLISLVDDIYSFDPNLTGATQINTAGTFSITGASITIPNNITIQYGDPSFTNRHVLQSVNYALPTSGKNVTDLYTFPMDVEYYQVITGFTVEQYLSLSNNNPSQIRKNSLNDIIRGTNYRIFEHRPSLTNIGPTALLTFFQNDADLYVEGYNEFQLPQTKKKINTEYLPFSLLNQYKSKNIILFFKNMKKS